LLYLQRGVKFYIMNDLLTELRSTKAELEKAISSISKDKFNTIPFEGSWTAAQVTEHIQNAIGRGVLYGATKPTDRKPDEKVAQTGNLFLNMDIKMQSPDFIYPSDKKYNKAEVLAAVNETFLKLIEAAESLDLSLTCLAFEIPGFGTFTRLEFVWFYVFHTQRHIIQLKKIANTYAR
jgi:hypothetical protein